jgi:short-subunit dehydrogenase
MLRVNGNGTINGTLAAVELMRAAGRGHIINIVSMAGLVAAPGEAIYGAGKHAAMAMTLGTLTDLRRDGVRGVHVSAVCPDGIWTPMLHDKLDDPEAAVSFSGTLLQPTDVARAAVALLDRPRPILILPRWRGPLLRAFDMFPRAGLRLLGPMLADARRRQRAYARKLATPPAPRAGG